LKAASLIKNKYKNKSAVLKAACFSNRINTLIHTLYQSKYFTSWVTVKHSLKTDVNLVIRPKKIISNILVSIPVTHENTLHVNCFCSFSPFDGEHSDTQLLYIGFYSLKSDISLVFKSVQIFCTFSCTKIHIQTSRCKECFKQVHKHYFILDSNQIPLKFLLHFFFHVLTFVPICSWAAGNKLCTLQEKESLGFLEQIRLCQPMDRLCICFELTESKVISTLLSVRKSVSPQDFCRIGAYYEVPSVSLYVFPNWTLVSHWTKYYYILNSLTFGKSGRKFKPH
jgi:hypothetical protein